LNKQSETDYEIELLNPANFDPQSCTHVIFLDHDLDLTNKIIGDEDLFSEKHFVSMFSHLKSLNPNLKVLLDVKSKIYYTSLLNICLKLEMNRRFINRLSIETGL
jgi:hypothetical protein